MNNTIKIFIGIFMASLLVTAQAQAFDGLIGPPTGCDALSYCAESVDARLTRLCTLTDSEQLECYKLKAFNDDRAAEELETKRQRITREAAESADAYRQQRAEEEEAAYARQLEREWEAAEQRLRREQRFEAQQRQREAEWQSDPFSSPGFLQGVQ